MNINELIREEIQSEMSTLKGMEVGSESHKIAINGITQLTDRVIDLEKLDIEKQEKANKQKEAESEREFKRSQMEFEQNLKKEQIEFERKKAEFERELRLQEMEEEKKDRLIKNCISGASIVGGIGLTIWGTYKTFKFEETGTITSTMGRKFINGLFFRR